MTDRQKTLTAGIEAALKCAETKPWRDLTLAEIAEAAGLKLKDFHQVADKAELAAAIDLALGLCAVGHAAEGFFATRNIHIDLTRPVESDGFYILSKTTQKIGKHVYCEATVYDWQDEPRVFATGMVRTGIRGRQAQRFPPA